MDNSYIIPFVKSVQKVFSTMLQLSVEVESPFIKKAGEPAHDVSGIIGMSGDVKGAVVLSFPTKTAERVVSLLVGSEMPYTHPDFTDAIGELVNMVSGGAKAQFTGKKVSISCPSVVIGSDHIVFSAKDVTNIMIPCSCDCGKFAVEVSIRAEAAPVTNTQDNSTAAA